MQVNWSETLFANRVDFNAFNNSAAEGSLLAGPNTQPALPAFFLRDADRKSILLKASGILSVTGTPTIIFQARLGPTAGSASLTGTSMGVSAAITTINNVSNARWELDLLLTLYTPGFGTGNSTLSGAGRVLSPAGFASPFIYDLEPTTPPTATWTATADASLANYFNLSATWSAGSASNTITCKSLLLLGLN